MEPYVIMEKVFPSSRSFVNVLGYLGNLTLNFILLGDNSITRDKMSQEPVVPGPTLIPLLQFLFNIGCDVNLFNRLYYRLKPKIPINYFVVSIAYFF